MVQIGVVTESAPPRPIKGSIGSRVRVILGDTGKNWLLLLNRDNGESKWQTHHWSNIPDAVAKQLNNCSAKGRYCRQIDFAPTGEWYIHGVKWDGTGGYSWWGGVDSNMSAKVKDLESSPHVLKPSFGRNHGSTQMCLISGRNGFSWNNVDQRLTKRISKTHKEKKAIHFVRLFGSGSYFIKDDSGCSWVGLGGPCEEELKKGVPCEDIAVANDGSWLIVNPDGHVASNGVSKELTKILTNFYTDQSNYIQARRHEIAIYIDRLQEETDQLAKALLEEQRRLREIAFQKARKAAERLARQVEEEQRREREIQENKLKKEKISIAEQEREIERRRRALSKSLGSLPSESRHRLQMEWGQDSSSHGTMPRDDNHCVVCQDDVPVRAVVPCGHLCLCDQCATTVCSGPLEGRRCPLCRNPVQTTMKIYFGCS